MARLGEQGSGVALLLGIGVLTVRFDMSARYLNGFWWKVDPRMARVTNILRIVFLCASVFFIFPIFQVLYLLFFRFFSSDFSAGTIRELDFSVLQYVSRV